jgi:malate dehydrogenase (oxaloacetate-decarboxylating)
LPGADVFIGVSAPNLLTGNDVAGMAAKAIVFGFANPVPEIDPLEAQQHAAVVATGRSDFPNQINNVLAFPGFFRGLLDGAIRDITDSMLIAAAVAIADRVAPDELNASYIIPNVFDSSWLEPSRVPYVRPKHNSGGRGHAAHGKPGQVSEIAESVGFLLSDRSGVVTGSVIDWDQNVLGGHDE